MPRRFSKAKAKNYATLDNIMRNGEQIPQVKRTPSGITENFSIAQMLSFVKALKEIDK